jgi:kynurenine formamidase
MPYEYDDMPIVDLTHLIAADMPVYPGTTPPVLVTGCAIDVDGFEEKQITMFSHTGTHIDAPAHLIKGAKTLNHLPMGHFYGKAVLLDCVQRQDPTIGIGELRPYEKTFNQIDFLLLNTGWHRYWGSERYYSGYPTLSNAAAQWLGRWGLKGIGLDTISADAAQSRDFTIHKTLLKGDTLIIENLTNLEKLPRHPFFFACFPLKIEDADGSPVRAVAFL